MNAEDVEALIESTARAIYEDEWIDSGMWPIPDAYRWEVDDDEMHLTYRRTARVAITPLLALVAGQMPCQCEPLPVASWVTDYVLADDDPLDKVIKAAGETQCEANRPGELSLQYRCTKPLGHDGKFHEDAWHVQWPNMKGSKEPVTYPHCTHCYDNYGWCKGKTEHYSYCRTCQTGTSSESGI
jgi:hypothetical protein